MNARDKDRIAALPGVNARAVAAPAIDPAAAFGAAFAALIALALVIA